MLNSKLINGRRLQTASSCFLLSPSRWGRRRQDRLTPLETAPVPAEDAADLDRGNITHRQVRHWPPIRLSAAKPALQADNHQDCREQAAAAQWGYNGGKQQRWHAALDEDISVCQDTHEGGDQCGKRCMIFIEVCVVSSDWEWRISPDALENTYHDTIGSIRRR